MGTTPYSTGTDARIQGRELTFDLQSAQPPIGQYVSKDDQLFIMTSTSVAGLTVTVFARMLMPDGTLQQNQWTIPVPQQRSGFFTPIAIPECFMLSCAATANTAFGQGLYVQATIARGLPSQGFQHLVLFKGFPFNSLPLSWPAGLNQTSVDCAGSFRSITGTTPAAGAEISETVPTFAKWRLYAIKFSLTCSASAGNRAPTLLLDDGSNAWARSGGNFTFGAGTTEEFTFSAGFTNAAAGSAPLFVMMPNPTILMPGWRVRTSTFGLLAGDQYTAPQYLVEEWLLP